MADGADSVRGYFEVAYDIDAGEMTSTYKMLDQEMTDILQVRAQLQEKVLRQACIYELEKQGYVVLSPESGAEAT